MRPKEINTYSVLMSVYKGEEPLFFDLAIQSMLNQSVKPSEFVLVIDGPLTEELNAVVNKYDKDPLFKIIRWPTNEGLGFALSLGVEAASNESILRMDADDYSSPLRAETLIEEYNNYPFDVCGTYVEEFEGNIDNVTTVKVVPLNKEDIADYAKKRNPINHPSVAFLKSSVLKAGNYQSCFLHEDYSLWVRMIQLGFEFRNLDVPLLKMRIDDKTFKRRGGIDYFKTGYGFQKHLFDIKFINFWCFLSNVIVRFIVEIVLIDKVRSVFYKNILRKKKK